MQHTIKLIDFLCYTNRKSPNDAKNEMSYNYVLYGYYQLNNERIIVNTAFDMHTLHQENVISDYLYFKKPTTYQMKLLLAEQHKLIQDIAVNKESEYFEQYTDITTVAQEEEMILLDLQYRYDTFNLYYLKQKQTLNRELNDICCQWVFDWYKKNSKEISYSEFKEASQLKMCLQELNKKSYLLFQ